MAEQFLNRLKDIEKSIGALDETLKRMITILGAMTEIRSDIRMAKDEILDAIKSAPKGGTGSSPDMDEIAVLIKGQFDTIGKFINDAMESTRTDILAAMKQVPAAAAPAPAARPPPKTTPAPKPEPPAPEIVVTPAAPTPATVAIPADKAMRIADELDNIIVSLKMGCKAGEVLDQMEDSRAEILKVVETDPVLVQLDKWQGVVAGYEKRKELQARDILKLKKEIRKEVPKYRPA
ncbi:MAG: hypothetical protein AM324_004580 [Candidatus Thorarchaeota archaeon SMTZ1-83]|nr:MAG: hypothetical protein AM324_05700 [Candidatus Thorarchaeota archaeon SMTZ1-83]